MIRRQVITAEMIRQYATASGDTAPIHLDNDAALQAGFGRPIAHGMLIMGLAQSHYLSEFPAHWITSYDMKFVHPVQENTEVCFDFSLSGDDAGSIRVTVVTANGEMIASGAIFVKEGNGE